jgi:hypothetical protein
MPVEDTNGSAVETGGEGVPHITGGLQQSPMRPNPRPQNNGGQQQPVQLPNNSGPQQAPVPPLNQLGQ